MAHQNMTDIAFAAYRKVRKISATELPWNQQVSLATSADVATQPGAIQQYIPPEQPVTQRSGLIPANGTHPKATALPVLQQLARPL